MANNNWTEFIDGIGQITPGQLITTTSWPAPNPEFRKSSNEIEDKVWFELDVTAADTIVIIHKGERIEIDKKDFLQKVGLEW